MVEISVLTEEELKTKFDSVCKDSWLISKMAKCVDGLTVREQIDNWPTTTRSQLLDKMNIKEHETYKQVYQNK